MIDIKKYLTDENDIQFIKDLYDCVEGQNEIPLSYKDNVFMFCPTGKAVYIHGFEGIENTLYDTLDDMLLNFMLDGKPFIEQIDYIDFA